MKKTDYNVCSSAIACWGYPSETSRYNRPVKRPWLNRFNKSGVISGKSELHKPSPAMGY
jgi:hypothetical protein